MPAWRQGQAVLTWREFGNTAASLAPNANPALNPTYPTIYWRKSGGTDSFDAVWQAWSGAAYNDTRGWLRLMGEGHDDGSGNEVVGLNIFDNDPQWFLATQPSGAVGNTGLLDDLNESSSVYFDGRPRASHTYGNLVFVGDDYWLAPLGSPYRAGSHPSGLSKAFRLRGGTWAQVGGDWPGANNANYGSVCHDPSRGKLIYVPAANIQLRSFDLATDVLSSTSVFTGAGGQNQAIYVPAPWDLVVVLNAQYTGHLGVYDYGRTAGTTMHQPGITGSAPVPSTPYNGLFYPNGVWVPSLGAVVAWHGGTGLWKLTPPAAGNPATTPWTGWEQIAAAPANTLDPGNPTFNGMYGRVFYSPTLKGIGISVAHNKRAAFFALE
jgi:hypothetical protein